MHKILAAFLALFLLQAVCPAKDPPPVNDDTITDQVRIKLADESLLPDLLAFLRSEGCVAYYEGGGVETVRPSSFGEQEATELHLVVSRWRNEHPETQIELSD